MAHSHDPNLCFNAACDARKSDAEKLHDPEVCVSDSACPSCKIAKNDAILAKLAHTARPTSAGKAKALAILLSAGAAGGQQAAPAAPASTPAAPAPATQTTRPGPGRIALLALSVLGLGCAVPQEAVDQAARMAEATNGLAVREENSDDVRAIGARESTAWRRQYRALTGEEVPGSDRWRVIPPRYLAAPGAGQ